MMTFGQVGYEISTINHYTQHMKPAEDRNSDGKVLSPNLFLHHTLNFNNLYKDYNPESSVLTLYITVILSCRLFFTHHMSNNIIITGESALLATYRSIRIESHRNA